MGCGLGYGGESGVNPKTHPQQSAPSPSKKREESIKNTKLGKTEASTSIERNYTVSEVTVSPAQFVLRQQGDVYNDYTLKRKIGEGKVINEE